MTPEEVSRHHDNLLRVVRGAFDGQDREAILRMVDDLGEMLVMCPASDRVDSGYATPGGLLAYMHLVMKGARQLAPTLAPDEDVTSIIKVALFHDIGRVGDPRRRVPYYVPETDSWKRDKLGKGYRYNEELQKMTHSSRSLYVLSCYGVPLTMHEWVAIQTAHGYGLEENRFYIGDDNPLVLLTQTSVRWALLS